MEFRGEVNQSTDPEAAPKSSYTLRLNQAASLIDQIREVPGNARDYLKLLEKVIGRKGTKPLGKETLGDIVKRAREKRLRSGQLEQEQQEQQKRQAALAAPKIQHRSQLIDKLHSELQERGVDHDFAYTLNRIDRELFEAGTENSEYLPSCPVGWRSGDVFFGLYLAPGYQAVPSLLNNLANKVNGLESKVLPRDYDRFIAWVTWMLISIHPKQDGNGRLGKAVAEFMLNDRNLLNWKDSLWGDMFGIAEQEIISEVTQRTGNPFPDLLSLPASQKSDLMKGFYRFGNHDHAADILQEAIDQTQIAPAGEFQPKGLSPAALGLMEKFLAKAPAISI